MAGGHERKGSRRWRGRGAPDPAEPVGGRHCSRRPQRRRPVAPHRVHLLPRRHTRYYVPTATHDDASVTSLQPTPDQPLLAVGVLLLDSRNLRRGRRREYVPVATASRHTGDCSTKNVTKAAPVAGPQLEPTTHPTAHRGRPILGPCADNQKSKTAALREFSYCREPIEHIVAISDPFPARPIGQCDSPPTCSKGSRCHRPALDASVGRTHRHQIAAFAAQLIVRHKSPCPPLFQRTVTPRGARSVARARVDERTTRREYLDFGDAPLCQ